MRLYKIDDHPDYQAPVTVDDKFLKLTFKINGENSIKKELEELGTYYFKFIDTRLKAMKDYNEFTSTEPIFSPKAVEVLKDFFVDGELLEIKTLKEKSFYLYNIFPEIDCLDEENSDLVWNSFNTAIITDKSKRILFKTSKIDRNIFREKVFASCVFVTDTFVKRVIENDLKGFKFISYWDSELGDIREKEIIYIPPRKEK